MFVCFTFQNHALPASYSGVIVAQPVFYQTVLGHLFPSNLTKPMTVDTSGFLLSASRKLFCCCIFLRPKGWDLPGSSLASHDAQQCSCLSQPPGAHLFHDFTELCPCCSCDTPRCLLSLCHGYEIISQLIAVNLFTKGSKKKSFNSCKQKALSTDF